MLGFALFDEIAVKTFVIRSGGELDDWTVRLESLDKNRGGVEMTTANTTDNLSKELVSSFFGGVIREGKPSVGLNDANSGEVFKI